MNSTDFLVHGVAFRMTKESFKHKTHKSIYLRKIVMVERHLFRRPRQNREAESSLDQFYDASYGIECVPWGAICAKIDRFGSVNRFDSGCTQSVFSFVSFAL